MKPTERAWLAGIIDGEGSIVLYRCPPTASSCVVQVSVQMCSFRTVRRLRKLTGVGSLQRRDKGGKWSDTLTWQTVSSGALSVLRSALPFLYLKQKQARLALEVGEEMQRHGRGHSLTAREKRWRETRIVRMHRLNRRGK